MGASIEPSQAEPWQNNCCGTNPHPHGLTPREHLKQIKSPLGDTVFERGVVRELWAAVSTPCCCSYCCVVAVW